MALITNEEDKGTHEITLTLDAATAEKFKKFCEHEQIFDILLQSNVFNIKNGQAVINFNSVGTLMNVEINSVAYQRRKP